MAKGVWAGLDVGAETTSVCVIDDGGQVLHRSICGTAVKSVHRELAFIKRRRRARVFLEASTGIHLARGLRNLGYDVTLFETRQLSKFLRVRRNKTDTGDAIGIAEAGRLGASVVSNVHLKTLECQCLQARLAVRRRLLSHRVAARNLLGRLLDDFGARPKLGRRPFDLRRSVEAEIRKVFGKAPSNLTSDLYHLVAYCEQLSTYERAINQELKVLADSNEVCRRFMEIPGVGPLCALTFYAAVDEPARFKRSSRVGAYLGLAPRIWQSGGTARVGRISKMGNRAARTLLVHASMLFMRYSPSDCVLRQWVMGVEQRSGRGRARVALARKLATIMIAMWKNGLPYDAKFCPTA